MTSWAVSSINLCEGTANISGAKTSRTKQLLRLAWQTLAVRCQQVGEFFSRESNKPLPKDLRRSLRLNKSAKRKGYHQYQTAEDKRLMKEFLNRPVSISIRVGPAYEYTSSNC